ncbi:MAG TPA: SgcJ/EcaC family oxidoreductase [Stellaceae bacterium]|nr:SgcJ/EcaC family oxidoreductase [Stellaceae bacterium]
MPSAILLRQGIADERSASTDRERVEARQVAESVVKSFMAAYNTNDPKAISALFLPDAMLLGIDGVVSQGREAIERTYAAALKNLGGHFTVVIKDAIPLGDNVVVANDEIKIAGAGQHSDQTINGRAVITLAKTPEGWRYAAISAQKLPPSELTTGSRQ